MSAALARTAATGATETAAANASARRDLLISLTLPDLVANGVVYIANRIVFNTVRLIHNETFPAQLVTR